MSKRKEFDKNEITDLYHIQRKSLEECSKILNTSRITLTKWMINNGVLVDSNRKFRNPAFRFSEEENEILNGCLLGDGHLTKPVGKSSQFTYCSSEYEHVYFVYSHLKRFIVNECVDGPLEYTFYDKRTNKNYTRYSIRTQSNISFYNLRQKWYPRGVKIIPTTVDFTPTTLLFWYIGDGGLIKGQYYQYLKLSTNAFSEEDLDFVQSKLKCFEPKIYGESQKLLYIPRHRIRKFLDMIGPCPVLCYKHKWEYDEYKYEGCLRRQDEV